MKTYYIIVISLLLLSCEKKKDEAKNYPKFNITSATKFLELAENIQKGKDISQKQWQELFQSDGYRNYLIYNDSLRKKELIKEVMLTVYDDSNNALLDSLLSLPITPRPDYLKLAMIKNFQTIKENFEDFKTYTKKFQSEKIIRSADSLARMHIPKKEWGSLPELYPVYMVSVDQDGSVKDNAIVIDLNLTYQLNNEGVIKLIAHEFHHNYRQLTVKKYEHPLMVQLNKIHQEGIADLIDKEKPPLESLLSLPKSLVDAYNQDYLKAPENLKKLDSLSQLYFTKKIDEPELSKQLNRIVGFGGHTLGIYMSFLIDEHLGQDILIESYNDPIQFFKIYNDLAKKLDNEYSFSETFIDSLETLK